MGGAFEKHSSRFFVFLLAIDCRLVPNGHRRAPGEERSDETEDGGGRHLLLLPSPSSPNNLNCPSGTNCKVLHKVLSTAGTGLSLLHSFHHRKSYNNFFLNHTTRECFHSRAILFHPLPHCPIKSDKIQYDPLAPDYGSVFFPLNPVRRQRLTVFATFPAEEAG
jgi:hypothetical protein